MDRRTFLAVAGSGLGGVLAGGAAVPAGRAEAHLSPSPTAVFAAREAAGAAEPGAARAALGTRSVVWSVATTEAVAALTFDDGPDPEFTPRVLAALDRAGVRATFNVMGWNAVHHPALLREIVAAGHEIGNHTWTHEDLSQLSPDAIRDQVARGRDAIASIVEAPVRFFRPPRGELAGAAVRSAAELGYDVLLWSVSRGPGPSPGTPGQITAYVGSVVQAGDVVCLHDGIGRGTFHRDSPGAFALRARRDVEVRALPDLLSRLADRGLRLDTASRLVAGTTAARHLQTGI